MTNDSSRDFLELRKALERLRDALAEAVRALDDPDPSASEGARAYSRHGSPFGAERKGRRLWNVFRQYTTRN